MTSRAMSHRSVSLSSGRRPRRTGRSASSTTASGSRTTSGWPPTASCSGRWSRGSRGSWTGGRTLGPSLPTRDVYLRTATAIGRDGWANWARVPMEDYRWGIFLSERDPDRAIGFGQHQGEPAWQEVPGEYRADLRRLLVIQGDTEPASVEQQRHLGATAPSLYDLRNLFQVNVEEGRHLWAMVYLLHAYFGRDGREEAEQLLRRHSGDPDSPRILGAFNEQTTDWLSFFMFTYFTDRDGKYQLGTLKESGFDPLARTVRVHAPRGGAPHVRGHHRGAAHRPADRAAAGRRRRRPTCGRTARSRWQVIQKYLNFQFSVSLDLFGSETSSNVAGYYTAGLKGRWMETRRDDDHQLTDATMEVPVLAGGIHRHRRTVPMLTALNLDLRNEYVAGLRPRPAQVERRAGRRRAGAAADAAARGLQPPGRRVRRAPRQPGRRAADRGGVGAAGGAAGCPTDDDRAAVAALMARALRAGRVRELDRAAGRRHQRPPGGVRLRAILSGMLDGRLLVDAHVHVAGLRTVSADWQAWLATFGDAEGIRALYDADGRAAAGRDRRALRRPGRRPRAAVQRVQPQGHRHPADRGPAADRGGQPRPVPPGGQPQPAPALPGRRRAGPPGRAGRGGVQDPPGARRVRGRRPDALPGLRLGARSTACRSSCTAAPRPSPARSTPTPTRRCSTRCSATSPA